MAGSLSSEHKSVKYEYLDHTADVQLHAWGDDLKEAFEQVATAMFGYMTDLNSVDVVREEEIMAEGDDIINLLFHFLDEFLFLMCADPYFIVKEVEILEFDKENFKIRAIGRGEEFDLNKHPQGTEVKAITYSNMQVHDNDNRHDVYVIIDI
ncbi:protein archease-like isoform X1 [Acropora millepora]|uniref:protein archease-like isoform X1 n=1 Tax=Acropora millepora TaxID=45264 RepID=UPI001CF48351|nr:protein archease-like isoform X1 [Acropora millepora]